VIVFSDGSGGDGPAMHTEDATPWTAKPSTTPGTAAGAGVKEPPGPGRGARGARQHITITD